MRPSAILSVLFVALCGLAGFAGEGAKDMIKCEIALPKGEVYLRGETDPVADLVVSLTLKNTTPADKRETEQQSVRRVKALSPEQIAELSGKEIPKAEMAAKVEAVVKASDTTEQVQVEPINKDSFGFAYTIPELGPQDLIEFVITKMPEEGKAPAEGAKPQIVARDMPIEYTAPTDRLPNAYLAPGATSPEFILPVGRFYRVIGAGQYSIKAILSTIRDSSTTSGCVESNELQFRVLPFKIVERKLTDLKAWWSDFERGTPEFEYMFYQLPIDAPWQEVYFVRKRDVRGIVKWEWRRLCTVVQGGQVQLQMIGANKVAVLAPQATGDAGLYTVDFTPYDTAVTSKNIQLAGKKMPTLSVSGGEAKAE
jgi:hypothetical protein